jgi:hypothetical protein
MRRRLLIVAVAAVSLLIAASAAAAAGWKSTSTIALAQPLAAGSTTAAPHFGDRVSFAVTTTATDRPYVILDCYQDGNWVSTASAVYTPSTGGHRMLDLVLVRHRPVLEQPLRQIEVVLRAARSENRGPIRIRRERRHRRPRTAETTADSRRRRRRTHLIPIVRRRLHTTVGSCVRVPVELEHAVIVNRLRPRDHEQRREHNPATPARTRSDAASCSQPRRSASESPDSLSLIHTRGGRPGSSPRLLLAPLGGRRSSRLP